MKKFLLCSLFGLLILSRLWSNPDQAKNQTKNIKITADEVFRDPRKNQVSAQGNVKANYQGTVIYADHIEYFEDSEIANADGEVRLRDSEHYMKGENLEYNLLLSSGVMRNAKALAYSWIVRGREMFRHSKDLATIAPAKISSCDHDKPHYYFRASKVKVYFGRKMVAYNVVLFIKGIPVFYFPVFVQSLKDKKIDISVTVGQGRVDGNYIKTTVKYDLGGNEKITLYVDKYEYRGWGLGTLFEYQKDSVNSGSIYLYGIDDTIDDIRKRTFRMNHIQKLSKRWQSYTKINYQNDESFDQDLLYSNVAEEGVSRVNTNIYSYTSLNYVGKMYSMNTTWQMEHDWNDDDKVYKKSTESLPSFSLDSYQNKFFVDKLYYSFGFGFINSYHPTNDTYYGTGSAYFDLTRTINLTPNITLTPSTGLNENLTNTAGSSGLYEEGYTTQWQNSITLKDRLTRDLDISLIYSYNAGMFDKKTKIFGNSLSSVMNNYFLNNKLRLSSSISYDLNTDVDSTVKRYGSLLNSARWKLAKKLNYYGKHEYNFAKRRTELLQNVLYFFPSARWTISENLTAMESKGDIMDAITSIKYRPNLKWKFDFSIRNEYDHVRGEVSNVRDREFSLYRDLHCWEVKFSVLDKYDDDEEVYREFWLTFNLKALPGQNITFYREDRKEYYPHLETWDLSGEAY
ncbi:MAG: LPS-assembly protein LptD [bacterium]|nr:LPS-assembly protein LptD [bacterium]